MVPGRFSWFKVGFSCFFMILGARMVFHGSGWVFIVSYGPRLFFYGTRSVFHAVRLFLMATCWLFMVLGRFSWFLMVPGSFFMVFQGSRLIFHGFP